MKNIIFVIVLLSVVVGCATHHSSDEADEKKYRVMLDTWIGAPVAALVERGGYPDSQFLAPNGNMVYVYSRSMNETTPMTARTYRYDYLPNTTMYSGGETITYWCKTFFEVGKDEKIIRWSLKGNLCI